MPRDPKSTAARRGCRNELLRGNGVIPTQEAKLESASTARIMPYRCPRPQTSTIRISMVSAAIFQQISPAPGTLTFQAPLRGPPAARSSFELSHCLGPLSDSAWDGIENAQRVAVHNGKEGTGM